MKYWSKALIRSLVGRIIFFMSKVFTLSNILFWLYNCIKLSQKRTIMTQKYSYSLGLDIGTSSIGWAVLDLDK